jgi:hypothetical protein
MKAIPSSRILIALATLTILPSSTGRTSRLNASLDAASAVPSVSSSVAETYGRLPLSFEANQGQTAAQVKFLSREPGYTLFLTPDEAVFALRAPSDVKNPLVARRKARLHDATSDRQPQDRTSEYVLRMKLLKSNPSAKVEGTDSLPGRTNYFPGSDPAKWRTNIPTYAHVRYRDVYAGIDLAYYGNRSGRLEHDFIVRPGADPRNIALTLDGADRYSLDQNGDLQVSVGQQTVTLQRPAIYQEDGKGRQSIVGQYRLTAGNRLSFEISSYDRSKTLVIDPVLNYSTFLGGGNGAAIQYADAVAVDASGNAYVTGHTGTTDFPTTPSSFQPTCDVDGGCSAVFVTKLNAAGSKLVYSTYIGGTLYDEGYSIAVDSSGNAYVAGKAESSNFPTTTGAFQATFPGAFSSGFVTKLNSTGSKLVYSTFLGGSGGGLCYLSNGSTDDLAHGIAIDANGNAYVTGCTDSPNFPTTAGAFDRTCHGCGNDHGDAFVSKLNANGTALVYSTFLGGSDLDVGYSIAVDANGNAYVGGSATSENFPITAGAFQTTKTAGGQVGFITKVNPTGTGLVYSTFLGGSDADLINGLALDKLLNVYATGYASSSNFPITANAFQKTCKDCTNQFSSFVTKLNSTGKTLAYSTFLGGSGSDIGTSITVDALGDAFVTGQTESTDFPTVAGAFQTTCHDCNVNLGTSAAFITQMNPTGSALKYSTFLGGTRTDYGTGIALDSSGNAYITGGTGSSDFPVTKGSFDVTCKGCAAFGTDAFITKFLFGPPTTATVSPTSLTFGSQALGTKSAAKTVTLTNTGTSLLEILSISFSGTNSKDFIQTNTCGGSVAAGKACTISVSFQPTADGTRAATMNIADNTNNSPQKVTLSGTGTGAGGPGATLSPKSLTFAAQQINTTGPVQTAKLTNTGTAVLNITSLTFTGTDPTQFGGTTTCTTTLAVGASCSISVQFKPTFGGTQTAAVSIADNASDSPQMLALSGKGLGPGATYTPAKVTFPAQVIGTTSAASVVKLTNNGTTALSISAASFTGTDATDFSGTTTCTTSLAVGSSCTFTLKFTPRASGTRTASLQVADNTGSGLQLVPLTGVGTKVKLSAKTLAFGTETVGTRSTAKTVTLTNVSATALSITSIAIVGTDPADFAQSNTCGASVAAGKSCTISVTFTPKATGARTATVHITDNGGASPQSITLTGTGG